MLDWKVRAEGDALPFWKRVQMDLSNVDRVHKSMGVAAAKEVRTNFRSLDRERHRGFSSSNFYGGAAGATNHEVQRDGSIHVLVGDGLFPGAAIALRYFGGTVEPVNAKYLTIPVADEAQGKRVREFGDDIEFIINRRTGKGVVTLADRVLYALTKKTTHEADDSVLPDMQDIRDAMADAATETIERLR